MAAGRPYYKMRRSGNLYQLCLGWLVLALAVVHLGQAAEQPSAKIEALRKAAEQGKVSAQINLGVAYLEGDGVGKDPAEGIRWMRKAAEQGEKVAQYNLGGIYLKGNGTEVDLKEAAKWFKLAAEQGEGSSQQMLGVLYATGQGVKPDLSESYKWFTLAIDNGDDQAQGNLNLLKPHLKPVHMEEGRRRAMAFKLGVPLAKTGLKGPTMAWAFLEDRTGNPELKYWRHSLTYMLSGQGRGNLLRVAPESSMEYGCRQLQIPKGEAFSESQVKRYGELLGVQRVISGHYEKNGKLWRVTVQINNTATGKASAEMTAESEDLYEVREQLWSQILKTLKIKASASELELLNERFMKSAEAMEWIARAVDGSGEKIPHAEMESMARQAVKLDPDSGYVHHVLAATLANQGKMAEAETEIRKAIRLAPHMAFAYQVLGAIQNLGGKTHEAETNIRRALKENAGEAESFLRLGECYIERQQWKEALFLFEEAKKLAPLDATIHAKLAVVYAHQQDREHALAAIKESKRIDKDSIPALQAICDATMVLRDYPAAVESRDRFVTLAKAEGLNPEAVSRYERTANNLRTRLLPEPVTTTRPKQYSETELEAVWKQRLNPQELALVKNPMGSNEAMRKWAVELTTGATDARDKAHKLFDALNSRLSEDGGGSRTALETFAVWPDNKVPLRCQEYARLYVALARAVGVEAYFVYVSEDNEGKGVIHACAGVIIDGVSWLIDPMYAWYGVPHRKYFWMDDLQATALYLNQLDDTVACQAAVKLYPESEISQYNLAMSLAHDGKLREADEVVKRLEENAPEGWMRHAARGNLALILREYESALAQLKLAEATSPDRGKIDYMIAETYWNQQEWRLSRDYYRQAVSNALPGQQQDMTAAALRRIIEINEKLGPE